MEALSIQPVKANPRPAETQAQSALSDIFQALLRENLQQQEAPIVPPRDDARPEQDAPRHSFPDERINDAADGRRDRLYDRDTDYNAAQAPSDTSVRDREAPTYSEDTQAASQPDAPDQPSDSRGTEEITPARNSDTPAPDSTQGAEEQAAIVNDAPQASPNPTPSVAAQIPGAPNGGQANQANGALGKAGGVATAAAAAGPATNQAQPPASSQPSAPTAGTSTTPAAPASAGGNGISIQITGTPGQVVSTPNANLGGGAASAAIATAGNPESATPATPTTPNPEAANRTAQSSPVPASNSHSAQQAGSQPGTSSTGSVVPADTTQSASTAAPPVQREDAIPASAQPRSGIAQSGPAAEAALHNGSAETASTRTAPVPGTPAQDATGQNDGAKTNNAQNQHAQGTPQAQPDQTPKAAAQNTAATNPQAAAVQGAQAGIAKASGQGEPGSRGAGSPADAASNRASSVSTLTPSGFAQAAAGAPDTLGSLTRSGGTHSSTATQVATEIQKAVIAGKDQIRIRLHPAELGQIDVTLKVRNDGTVKVTVTTERLETFDLMQRDSRGLERALQDAGLKTDSGSLSFNLRGGDQHAPNGDQRGQGLAAQSNPEADRKAEAPPPEADTPAPVVSDRALDIHV